MKIRAEWVACQIDRRSYLSVPRSAGPSEPEANCFYFLLARSLQKNRYSCFAR